MGKKSTPAAPPAPDPIATAQAQTTSNVNTAVANTTMGNANETNPYGSVTYTQTGTKDVGGNAVPTYQRDVRLSDAQQGLLDQQNQLGSNLNNLALQQSSRISDVLSQPVSSGSLPSAIYSLGNLPNLQTVGSGPGLQTGYDVGKVGTTFGDAGQVQTGVGPNDFSADRLRVESALNDRLNPQLQQSRSALETQLVNQGLVRGTSAFNSAMDEASRRENDAHLAVTAQGGQEQSRQFADALSAGNFANSAQNQNYQQQLGRATYGMAATGFNNEAAANAASFGNEAAQQMYGNQTQATMANNAIGQQGFTNAQTAADFANTSRERALQEQLALRNQPINEISALMNGGQVTAPQFTQYKAGTVDGTPVGQYIYQSAAMNQDAWKTKVQAQAQANGGLYGLGSSILGLGAKFAMGSDRRLKANIVPLGIRTARGFPLYEYDYLPDGSHQVGVMADEVATAMPDAIHLMPGGFMAVDYAMVL